MLESDLEFITGREAAKYLNIGERRFRALSRTPDGPPKKIIGKRWMFQRAAIKEWLESLVKKPRSRRPGAVLGLRSSAPPRRIISRTCSRTASGS